MGTSLTGLTPATTYDALIKVGDNGPLSATAKYLSDGLGNDSALALSTTAVGIGTTTPYSKLELRGLAQTYANSASVVFTDSAGTTDSRRWLIGNVATDYGSLNFAVSTNATDNPVNSKMTITKAGNVGIGTTTPSAKLTVVGTGEYDGLLIVRSTGSGTPQAALGVDAVGSGVGYVGTVNNIPLQIRTNDVTRLRVDADGLKFGSDTAAANALDDYEEGTWTMGISFGGASVGVTYASNTGSYTKIGRQVTVTGAIFLTSKGSSTGAATITGLPFTVGNSNANYSASALRFKNITFTNQFQGFANRNTTQIVLEEITVLGTVSDPTDADFANNSEIIVGLTYFV